MDIGRGFTYAFDDEDWLKKILIGGVVTLVPILNFVGIGYALRATKNAAEGRDLPLPEWDDWGGDFVRGLLVFLAGVIYALPAVIVMGLGVAFGAALDSDVCVWLGYCPGILWAILVEAVMPALWLKFAKEEQFGSFFKFAEIWAFVRDNISDYIIVVLMIWVAEIVASIVGIVACIIGLVFTTFWAYLVQAQLLGQVDRGASAAQVGTED